MPADDSPDRDADAGHPPEERAPAGVVRLSRFLAGCVGFALAGVGLAMLDGRLANLPAAGVAAGLGAAFAIPALWPGRPAWALVLLVIFGGLGAFLSIPVLAFAMGGGVGGGGGCCFAVALPVLFTIAAGAAHGLSDGRREPEGHGFEVNLTPNAPPANPPEAQLSNNDRPK